MDNQWDVIVIGGGAAGLSAALMLGRARRRTLVLDAGSPRNRFAAHMHGVLGHEGVPPGDLVEHGRREVAAYGVEHRDGDVLRLDTTDHGVRLTLAGSEVLTARAAIVATGLTDELPEVPGLAERWGSSVLHCPYCHGWEVRDRRLGVLTTSPMSMHQAELVRQWSDTVTVFTAGLGPVQDTALDRLRSRGIELVGSPVVEVTEDDATGMAVRTADGATTHLDALFTAGTPRPHDGFLAHLGLDRTETPFGSFLAVDPTGKTSDGRIWAVGNVVNPAANVPLAVGAGSFAGAFVNAALVTEEFDAAATRDAGTGSTTMDEHTLSLTPEQFWEDRYAGTDSTWSGRPNQVVVDVVSSLTPGRALDLGCGEGGDAIWLAGNGWDVTGVDISATAVQRATDAARAAGLADATLRFQTADLSVWGPDEEYDLVTASFLQSPVALPRAEVLRRAAGSIAPGGHLLVLTHAAPASWASEQDTKHHQFFRPDEEVAALDLPTDEWAVVLAETRTRPATSPDGHEATLEDSVILVRRR